jgi:hypothetical protein
MNKLIILIVGALTIGAATAHDDYRKDDKKELSPAAKVLKKIKSADKHKAKVGGKRKLSPAMAKFDKNKDGKLCEVERKAAKAAFMKRFDKNKDGKLDEKERKAAMAERRKNAQKPKGKGKKKPAPKKGGKKG